MMERKTIFILSLVGGIFLILGALFLFLISLFSAAIPALSNYAPDTFSSYFTAGLLFIFAFIGLIAGIITIIGSFKIKNNKNVKTWGIVLIVCGVFGFLSSKLGAIATLLAGIFALINKEKEGKQNGKR